MQSITCLTVDMCLTADPGVVSSILAQSHTFLEIDHEIASMAIHLASPDARGVVVRYKQKYLHRLTSFSNLPRKKVWLGMTSQHKHRC